MKLLLYQVDAFTDHVFGGNPAAVVLLNEWLPDDVLQNIALENNLSETAFIVPDGSRYHIRWFTPSVEVNLCGHATLASSHVLFRHLSHPDASIEFKSRSGTLSVRCSGDLYLLDFPSDAPQLVESNDLIRSCFDRAPVDVLKGSADYLLVFNDEEYVRNASPNLDAIKKLDAEGIIITAPGSNGTDFVSRFFAPQLGIPEDPVTGSAHTVLVPYWAGRLDKKELSAMQVSRRGGILQCRYNGDRVEIGGKGVTYLQAEITL